MRQRKKRFLYGVGVAAAAGSLLMVSGCNMGQYEEPAYAASAVENNIEIRDYKPVIAAEVEVTGERNEAISKGFRLIADYIFGNNEPKAKIAMTTPVIQQADAKKQGEEIAMTTPVIQQAEGKGWKVQFIMPAEYTLQTLPKPVNQAVKLRLVFHEAIAIFCACATYEQNAALGFAMGLAHGVGTKSEPTILARLRSQLERLMKGPVILEMLIDYVLETALFIGVHHLGQQRITTFHCVSFVAKQMVEFCRPILRVFIDIDPMDGAIAA